MAMKPYFSVLVPVYNVEKYLSKCIDSLLNQTFPDIEIICINDGSCDQSLSILNSYAQKDSRIYVINQENRGYGAALNKAFQYAQAEYISIIEPDDFLELNTYELFYNDTQLFPEADIIKYAYWNFMDTNEGEKISPSNSSNFVLPPKLFNICQHPQLLLYHPSIWSCIYKMTYWKEKGLSFIEAPGAAWTDNPFFITSMYMAKNILWRNQKVYYYRQGHATSSSNLTDCKVPLLRIIEILDFVEKEKISDFGFLLCIYKRVVNHINIARNNEHYNRKQIEPIIKTILLRLDFNIINTSFFSEQEKNILCEYDEMRNII